MFKRIAAVLVLVLLLVQLCAPTYAEAFRIVTTNLPDGTISEEYSAQIEVRGEGANKATFELYNMTGGFNDFPDGLTLTSEGEVVGIPTEYGEFIFWVYANSGYNDVYGQITLVIQRGDYVEPLSLTTQDLPAGTAGSWYSSKLEAKGEAPYTFSVEQTEGFELPAGLHISSDGYISGTPEQAGEYTVSIVLSNGIERVVTQLPLSIATAPEVPAQQPSITAQPQSVSCEVGESVNASVTASVSDGGTLSYQWYQSRQPNYNSATRLEGETGSTLTFKASTEGIFYFFVSVTNTLSDTQVSTSVNSEHFALTVTPATSVEPEPEPKDGFPGWAIGVIAGLAGVCVVLAILLVRSKSRPVSGKHDFRF